MLVAVIGFTANVNAQGKNYKDSYDTNFICIATQILLDGNVYNPREECRNGAYDQGYHDGYYGKSPDAMLKAAVGKVFKQAGEVSRGGNGVSVSADELSYAMGFADGEKDKRKEGR